MGKTLRCVLKSDNKESHCQRQKNPGGSNRPYLRIKHMYGNHASLIHNLLIDQSGVIGTFFGLTEAMDKSNLIVNYLPTAFVEDDLRALFNKFGPIHSIKVGLGKNHV
jgi:hypothetical protein